MPRDKSTGQMLFITNDALAVIWEQLSIYESSVATERLIKQRANDQIDCKLLESKVEALAYCIRTAKDYMHATSTSLTAVVTSNYYGCLWLAAACAVATPSADTDLDSIERATKKGHGLANLADDADNAQFPDNEYAYIKEQGFYRKFLEWTGTANDVVKQIAWSGKSPGTYSDVKDEQKTLCISVSELLARIPELGLMFEQVTGRDARCFELFPASNGLNFRTQTGDPNVQAMGVYGDYSRKYLLESGLALDNLCEYQPHQKHGSHANSRWAGFASHIGEGVNFFDYVGEHPEDHRFYQSPIVGYHFISPLLGVIQNPLAIHLMLSYELSILARYRPAIWRRILEGNLDQYRILITAYNRIFERIVPQLALCSIVGRRVRVPSPGVWG
ncbi:MAG TPA: hypothetical protein V6C81_07315 [Planktothrix sp.]|jgi:hypothetical protein